MAERLFEFVADLILLNVGQPAYGRAMQYYYYRYYYYCYCYC